MRKEYTREEAIEKAGALTKKLAQRIEELSETAADGCGNFETALYLQKNGKEFTSILEEIDIKEELAEYDNETIAMVLGKILPAAIEFGLEKNLTEDFIIVDDGHVHIEENKNYATDSWKVYLKEKNEIAKAEYGADKTKVQVIQLDGSTGGIIDIGTEEYRKTGGFAKRLLKAAGLNATDEAGLRLQEKMLDSGLFYINKEEGWIEKKKYFERMTPKDFLSIQDYKDVTVKAVYNDGKGELTFTYTAGGKTENLFMIKASNRQKKRKYPTISGENETNNPDDIMYTTPPYGEEKVPYIPGKFPKGNWKITSFEKNGEKEYGPYKIRTNAYRYVDEWNYKYDIIQNKNIWKKKLDEQEKVIKKRDSGLLIHGGGYSESDLDNKKGSNKYTDTTLGCIRISNLDVLLIVKVLQSYIASKKFIALEVK